MNIEKVIVSLLLFCIFSGFCFSQTENNVEITIEITNVEINGGKVFLAIFSTAESFQKEKPAFSFELDANKISITKKITLKTGEYVISGFQDTNNNKELDYNMLGIPKEKIFITNYHGKGYPSKNFNKQKIVIDQKSEKISISLFKL